MCSGRHGMRHQTSQPTSATRTSVTSAYRQVPANMPVVGVKGVVWYADLPGGCPTFTPTRAYDPADNPFYDNLPHDIVEAGSAATVPADRKGLVGGGQDAGGFQVDVADEQDGHLVGFLRQYSCTA